MITLVAVASYITLPPVAAFPFLLLSLASLAWLIGFATEQLSFHLGSRITGILQTFIGNIPAFLIILFALKSDQVLLAESTIAGSILSNGLLVLGLVFLVGAFAAPDGVMRFKRALANDTITLLAISIMAIALVAVASLSGVYSDASLYKSSIFIAFALIFLYFFWTYSYLKIGGKSKGEVAAAVQGKSEMGLLFSIILLAIACALAALFADWLVSSVGPVIDLLDLSEAFVGIVIVAVAGNASMNYVAVAQARQGNSELAISLVKHSISQIPIFLYPALILSSLILGVQLTFALPLILVVSLVLSAILIWQVSDGEVDAFGGVSLVTAFFIIAIILFFSP